MPVTAANAFYGADGGSWDDLTIPLKGSFHVPTSDSTLTTGSDCLAWAYTALAHQAA